MELVITMAETLAEIIQSERNEILKKAFVTSKSDRYPSALEAIAIALEYNDQI